jgi:hypothetical protein
MVFCGHFGGRFSGSKKRHLLKIFLWIFPVSGWWGKSRRGGDRLASTTAFSSNAPECMLLRCQGFPN